MGENPTQQYKQRFSTSFISEEVRDVKEQMYCTINNKWYFSQHLIHTILNNHVFPHRKEPIQLLVPFNEVIDIITNNETTTEIMIKWHI